MLHTLRRLGESEAGGTIFENGLLAVIAIIAAVTLLGQVEGSIRDVFRDSAIQADTERAYR
jgi:Flp pilus assembly pilin Flp